VFGPVSARSFHGHRAGEKPYTRGSEPSKTFGSLPTVVAIPIRRATQIASAR